MKADDNRPFDKKFAVRTRGAGRPKALSAAQAATIFEAQVQIFSAQRLIDRTLGEAGVQTPNVSRILTNNWRMRGRVDLLTKQITEEDKVAAGLRPTAARSGRAYRPAADMRGGR